MKSLATLIIFTFSIVNANALVHCSAQNGKYQIVINPSDGMTLLTRNGEAQFAGKLQVADGTYGDLIYEIMSGNETIGYVNGEEGTVRVGIDLTNETEGAVTGYSFNTCQNYFSY